MVLHENGKKPDERAECCHHAALNPPLVRIEDLHVTLGGVTILDGVTAEIARGQITALIGLNGSGKTTLLRALLKEIPYTGRIVFKCGHDHSHPTPQHIGYVPQRLLFDPNLPLTVVELVTLALDRRPLFLGVSRTMKNRIAEMLRPVQASHLLHQPVGTLSGGELQRVLLALALEPQPELLLLDEPAAGIDFKYENEFYGLIDSINRTTGVTVVLVSHELSMVSRFAHHVLCLTNGRITCQGTPQMLTPEMLSQVFGEHKGVYAHEKH
jgi:zinc transport system ATP-binding protein